MTLPFFKAQDCWCPSEIPFSLTACTYSVVRCNSQCFAQALASSSTFHLRRVVLISVVATLFRCQLLVLAQTSFTLAVCCWFGRSMDGMTPCSSSSHPRAKLFAFLSLVSQSASAHVLERVLPCCCRSSLYGPDTVSLPAPLQCLRAMGRLFSTFAVKHKYLSTVCSF